MNNPTTRKTTASKITGLRLRGSTFHIKITGPGGQVIRESTGTKILEQAIEFLDRRRAELWRVGSLGERPRIALADAIADWLNNHSRVAKKTYEDDRRRIRTMLPLLPVLTIDQVKTATLRKLHADIIAQQGCGGATANRYLEIISAVLNYARGNDQLEAVPKIPYAREVSKTPPFLSEAEADLLLAELPHHLKAPAAFALATGLRESNVRLLEWRQIDLARSCAWVKVEEAKEEKAIAVPLSADAIAVLESCVDQHPTRVFTYRGKPVNAKFNNSAFIDARTRAGVPWCRWHDLRHTWASWHVMRGTPLPVLQKLGGWASLEMVMRYAHLAPDYTAQWVENSRRKGTKSAQSVVSTTQKDTQVVDNMGWLMGLEPTTTGITTRDSTN